MIRDGVKITKQVILTAFGSRSVTKGGEGNSTWMILLADV
jgi:hypothetical protein